MFDCRRDGGDKTHSRLVSLKLQPHVQLRGCCCHSNRIRPSSSTLSWQKMHKPVLRRKEIYGPVFPELTPVWLIDLHHLPDAKAQALERCSKSKCHWLTSHLPDKGIRPFSYDPKTPLPGVSQVHYLPFLSTCMRRWAQRTSHRKGGRHCFAMACLPLSF